MRAWRTSLLAYGVLVGLTSCTIAAQETGATPVPPSLAAFPTGVSTPLGARVDALLRAPAVAGAHWGIAVMAMDGTPLYGLDEAKLFRPASTAKLFTTVVALDTFGAAKTIKTGVAFPAADSEGTVHGDITIAGQNDPNLSARRFPYASPRLPADGSQGPSTPFTDPFDELAAGVAARGVRRVTGNLVASSWPWDPYPEGWAAEDLPWGYGAPVSSLSVADNQLSLRVTASSSPGGAASVTLTPDLGPNSTPARSPYRIDSTVTVARAGTAPTGVTLHHVPGEPSLRLTGTLAPGKSYTTEIAIDDPSRFAAEVLRQALLAHGVVIDGEIVAAREESADFSFLHASKELFPPNVPMGVSEPAGSCLGPCDLSVLHTSPSLIEDITATLKESLNLHAELMLRSLGVALAVGTPFTPAVEGARVVRSRVIEDGVADTDVVLYDGSGLSMKDLVTPRAEAQLLAHAAHQAWFPQWKAALPVGGVDGTLGTRFTDPPLKGHVFAKTGTLGESRALAGYVQCRSGREVIFAILDDEHEPGSSADRAAMDKIVEMIAAEN